MLDLNKLTSQALATANQLINIQKFDEAETVLKQLVKVSKTPQALNLLGLTYMNKACYDQATEQFRQALEIDDSAESHNNLGLSLSEIGKNEEASLHYHKALEIDPDNPNYLNNLALDYRSRGLRNEAIALFKKSLSEKQDKFTLLNLGSTLLEEKQVIEAMDCFEKAVQENPGFAPGHISLAYCLFLMGDWENGWAEYEYRFQHYPQAKTYRLLFPLNRQWDGLESLNDKEIILYCEQGIGDSFHFIRYAKVLKEKGAKVIVHCHPSLNSLFAQQDYIDGTLNVEKTTDPLPNHDYHCSLLSLPHLLGHWAAPGSSYLTAKKAESMKQYESYFKIGIIWAGNAEHPNDNKRSCPLRYFQPLYELPGVKLFSFQKDLRLRKYRNQENAVDLTEGAENLRAVHLGYHIQDWGDTASLLLEMDVVVSVDTAVLHLAGALGVPSIALLPYVPDWRWTVSGDKTIWYENMTLLRQNVEGDWSGVLEMAAREVKNKRPA